MRRATSAGDGRRTRPAGRCASGRRKGAPAGPPAADPPLKNKRVLVAAITAAVLVAVFAAVYVFLDRNSATPTPPAAYPVAVDGVVVTAGSPTAPVTLDVYEDYLCPYCERLENRSGGDIGTALNEGKIKVNYHALNILDDRTTPPGLLDARRERRAVRRPRRHLARLPRAPVRRAARRGRRRPDRGPADADRHGAGRRPGLRRVRRGQRAGARHQRRHRRRRPPTRACRPTASSARRRSRWAAARSTSRRPTGWSR